MKIFVNVILMSLAIAVFGCYGVRPSARGAEANTTSREINPVAVFAYLEALKKND